MMATLTIFRRGECVDTLDAAPGETLFNNLLAEQIPPTSVIVIQNDQPVSVFDSVSKSANYDVHILEGYDINSCRKLQRIRTSDNQVYTDRRLIFNNSTIEQDIQHLSEDEYSDYIENKAQDIITHYGLISNGDSVLVALSGESDSSAMLRVLAQLQDDLGFDIQTVTLREPRGVETDSFQHAKSLSSELNIPHRIVDKKEIEQIFNMSISVQEAFERIGSSKYQNDTITILETVHWKIFEHIADSNNHNSISLGAHLNEFVAGFLNAVTAGTHNNLGGTPKRQIGPFRYIYPVALLNKPELATYNILKEDKFPPTSQQNSWNVMPSEQSYLYYLSDMMRTYWPGIGHWIIENSLSTGTPYTEDDFIQCSKCEKYILKRSEEEMCIACKAFRHVDAV